MSLLKIADVLAALEAADIPADYTEGDPGVTAMCPLCVRPMLWAEGKSFICDCGSRNGGCEHNCNRSRIADEIHQRGELRNGGYGRDAAVRRNGNGDTPNPGDRYAGRVIDVAGMLASPDEPIQWRCEKFAADGFLTVLAGRGKEGKSWLMLALASGVANGTPAAGIRCTKGRALIFDAENGKRLIKRRFHAAAMTADLEVQPVETGGLLITKDLPWFKCTIEDYGANLVVFDSLKVLSGSAKENDSDAMEPLITALKLLARDTGAAVVLIHHRGRAEDSDYRGSSVILDQTDMMFRLGRANGDPDGKTRRKIVTVGCRIEEEPEPRWVQIVADRERGLVTVDEAEPFETDEFRPRDELRDGVLAQLTGIKQSGARIARALGRGKTDGTVRRVLEDLQAEGKAEKGPGGWGLPSPSPYRDGNLGNPPENGGVEPEPGLPTGLPTGLPLQPGEDGNDEPPEATP